MDALLSDVLTALHAQHRSREFAARHALHDAEIEQPVGCRGHWCDHRAATGRAGDADREHQKLAVVLEAVATEARVLSTEVGELPHTADCVGDRAE